MHPGESQPAEMSTLGSSLLGDSDGNRDNVAASAPTFSPGKFPLIHKVCMGVTSVMCATLFRWHLSHLKCMTPLQFFFKFPWNLDLHRLCLHQGNWHSLFLREQPCRPVLGLLFHPTAERIVAGVYVEAVV